MSTETAEAAASTINWSDTQRGFRLGEFRDRYGVRCSIQKSSLASEEAIWLGAEEARMHLTQEQVRELLPVLQHFAEHGELPE